MVLLSWVRVSRRILGWMLGWVFEGDIFRIDDGRCAACSGDEVYSDA